MGLLSDAMKDGGQLTQAMRERESVKFTLPGPGRYPIALRPADPEPPPQFDPQRPLRSRPADIDYMPRFDSSSLGDEAGKSEDEEPGGDPDTDTPTANPNGGGGSGALSGTGTTTQRLNAIEDAINFATISAVCEEDGTITVTLDWGVAPP